MECDQIIPPSPPDNYDEFEQLMVQSFVNEVPIPDDDFDMLLAELLDDDMDYHESSIISEDEEDGDMDDEDYEDDDYEDMDDE